MEKRDDRWMPGEPKVQVMLTSYYLDTLVPELTKKKYWKFMEVMPIDEDGVPMGTAYEKSRKHDMTPGTYYPSRKHVYIRPREGDIYWRITYDVEPEEMEARE